MMKGVYFIVVFILSALLMGCSASTAEDDYSDYLARIARTLNADKPEVHVQLLAPFPAQRALMMAEPDITMEFLDFLRLDVCDIQQRVAQRNSSLGKVMLASQRLRYEHELMQALSSCLARDGLSGEAREWMQEVLDFKRDIRLQIFWNNVIASPEMRRFFSPSSQVLEVTVTDDRQDIQRALSQLLQWRLALGREQFMSETELEKAYQQVGTEQYGGKLLQSALLAMAWLDAGTTLIHQSLDQRPVCPQGRDTPRSKIMQTILTKFFTGKLQPHLARIQRELQALSKEFAIVDMSNAPAAYRQYWQRYLSQQSNALPQQYTAAIKRHVQAWQRLLKQCGAMPTR